MKPEWFLLFLMIPGIYIIWHIVIQAWMDIKKGVDLK